jgi:5-deoxy-glucuronate isomerase
MEAATPIDPSRVVFRRTNAHRGRHISVDARTSPLERLAYGRIVLDQETPRVSFATGDREAGLICLEGRGSVTVAGATYELARHDALYVPRDQEVTVTTPESVDIAECSAQVEGRYPVQLVKHSEVAETPSLRFTTGGPSTTRTITILIGKNVQAGRLLAGVTYSEPGHWTSWPPHEHAAMLEEMYVYYDMPAPAFGVQFVYTDPDHPEVVEVVREGDAVLMPKGFHPNVSAPGHPIRFLWMMAAHREVEDRQFGVVRVQPGFDGTGSGLEASRK